MSTLSRFSFGILAVSLSTALSLAGDAADTNISFTKTHIDGVFRSEGVAAGDFNHDGKMDIAAGSVYYAAPDWKMVPILEKPKEFNPKAYSDSFCNFADDLNGDGWDDVIAARPQFWVHSDYRRKATPDGQLDRGGCLHCRRRPGWNNPGSPVRQADRHKGRHT